ncbi:MAG TPA: TIGR00730 family Rossman fold protein [Tepidisphaeraceae bacterium]|nr:TIGR00730 family Rossman fold protein [Tepidisphaeraceae bacterium]
MIRSVTVFCSSSSAVPRVYADAAAELGRAMAQQRWTLIYGGNNIGTMGALADACRAAGGQVVGVTPRLFIDKGVDDKSCHELVVTDCMRSRKAAMEQRGDAFIALPGGLGTLEEIFEIIVGKQLGYHRKPIVLLNVDGYFDPLLTMIDHGIEQHFITPAVRKLYFVAATVEEAIGHIRAPRPPCLRVLNRNAP